MMSSRGAASAHEIIIGVVVARDEVCWRCLRSKAFIVPILLENFT